MIIPPTATPGLSSIDATQHDSHRLASPVPAISCQRIIANVAIGWKIPFQQVSSISGTLERQDGYSFPDWRPGPTGPRLTQYRQRSRCRFLICSRTPENGWLRADVSTCALVIEAQADTLNSRDTHLLDFTPVLHHR